MNCVSYAQATTYCAATGGRLPTEAEWEFAARGPKGRIFPWGDTWNDAMGYGDRHPVGACRVRDTPDGIHDLAGNGREWTRELRSLGGERLAVLRGRSYAAPGRLTYALLARQRSGELTFAQRPDFASPYTGVRVAIDFPSR